MTLKELIAALQALDVSGQNEAPVIFEGREGEYHVDRVDTYRGGEDGELVVVALYPDGHDVPTISKF